MTTPPVLWRRAAALAVVFSLAFSLTPPVAAADAKKTYSLPAGEAAATLKAFSEQSGEQIVYPVDKVRGAQTNAVSGELSASDALQRLLAGSGLSVVRDEKTGAFAISPAAAASPTVSAKNVPSKTEVEKAAAADKAVPVEVVQMSPFEVSSEKDEGYLAQTSLSGTRLNSKLEDLAASISVVTKQQLQDTAATDINDIFKYELNTEGTSQFTSFGVDRGTVTDDVQNNPTGATRMRGLTAANTAVNGFGTALPFDTYDVDAVEISRGPNSTVFGLGNSGGGVNIIKSKANLTREVSTFTTRGDSYDGYRASFDLNRPIYKQKLAVRVFGLYEEKGYVRKPSQDTTRRLQVAFTARPFKNTTLNASFESYRNFNTRPNSLTPRDTTTDWIASGKPTWDPIANVVNFRDGRPSITGVTTANEATLLPYGLALTDSAFTNSPSAYIERDGSVPLFMISRMPAATGIGPNNVSGNNRLLQNSNFYVRFSTLNPLYNAPQITDKGLYDWTSLNLSAPNYGRTRGETSSVQLDQTIFNTPRQRLTVQGSWLYERIKTDDRRFLGSGAANLQPFIDVNEKLLDGTTNPYFLRTYIGGAAPSFRKGRNNNENYRTALAYELDLTREKNIFRWLGRHRLSGYNEYRAGYGGSLGFQDTISSNSVWMNGTPTSRNNTSYRTYPRYYVGDANGQNIDYAAARTSSGPYTYNLRYYNGVTQQWVNEATTYNDYYSANRLNRRLVSTQGGSWQGFLLGGRIVGTAGYRKDYSRTRDGNSAISPTAATNGYFDTTPMNFFGASDWVKNRGRTTNEGIVVKPLKWLHLSYSQSNSFSPGSETFDVNGEPLADPHGRTRDYGFQFNFFDGRLSVVAKQYETVDIGRSSSDLNTIVQRVLRMDRRTASGDPGLTDWLEGQLKLQHPEYTDAQIADETKRLSGVAPVFIRSHINRVHGDASDAVSRGKEVEIIYNPTRYWTMKAALTQSNPINGTLSPAVQNYIDERMPTWTTVKDPISGADWWTLRGANNTIPRDFYINNVLANLKLAVALQGKRRTQTREYRANFLTNFKVGGITDNKWLKPLDLGGSVRWEDKASIGFRAAPPDADGIVRQYDKEKPIFDKARYYCDFKAGYRLRFFNDKVRSTIQFNVNNVFENGRLQGVAVNPDGNPWAFRIIDPRQFILSASFDL